MLGEVVGDDLVQGVLTIRTKDRGILKNYPMHKKDKSAFFIYHACQGYRWKVYDTEQDAIEDNLVRVL